MKPEEAINELLRMKRVVNFHSRIAGSEGVEIFISNDYRDEFIGVMDTAIAATEKQIPKKPRYYMDMYNHERPGCPECPRNEILYAGKKYCSVCGTKIDWSDPKHD